MTVGRSHVVWWLSSCITGSPKGFAQTKHGGPNWTRDAAMCAKEIRFSYTGLWLPKIGISHNVMTE
mgnify:FL=1